MKPTPRSHWSHWLGFFTNCMGIGWSFSPPRASADWCFVAFHAVLLTVLAYMWFTYARRAERIDVLRSAIENHRTDYLRALGEIP